MISQQSNIKFKPNPLIYGANEDFLSAFRLAIRMKDPVDYEILLRSVEQVTVRYPYFCVFPEREEENLVLRHNSRPLPVFPDDRTVTLGSEESGGHLLSFGCKDNTIFIDCSHYLADGMGVDPLMKSLLYAYVSERYGTDGLEAERIRMPNSPIDEREHAYPFPDSALSTKGFCILPQKIRQEVRSYPILVLKKKVQKCQERYKRQVFSFSAISFNLL